MTAEELAKTISTMIVTDKEWDEIVAVVQEALEDAYNDGWDAGAEQTILEQRG